jgi:antitoxin MazE
MHIQVAKWGNSLAVRLPKALAIETGLAEGEEVEMSIENGRLVIEAKAPHYCLDDLLKKVTSKNLHQEIDNGGPVGQEVW